MSTPLFSLAYADALDRQDALATFRDAFHIPIINGHEQFYFCGNSLGLQPKAARGAIEQELDDWAKLGVEGHFQAKHPWMPYHCELRDLLAECVGAKPIEVVAMNSLTVNLHLLMVSFYRPSAERPIIIIEQGAFPSDRYAVESQIRFHGFDPTDCLIEIAADSETGLITADALQKCLQQHGHRVALILWPGVQYRTGQAFDLKAITELGHFYGCTVGFDLAHAVGNLPLQLHESGADFAAWCSYKYLNAGPGAIAGAFVHERFSRGERYPAVMLFMRRERGYQVFLLMMRSLQFADGQWQATVALWRGGHHLGKAYNQVQRCAQFVAHISYKFRFEAIGLLCGLLSKDQRAIGPF